VAVFSGNCVKSQSNTSSVMVTQLTITLNAHWSLSWPVELSSVGHCDRSKKSIQLRVRFKATTDRKTLTFYPVEFLE